MRINTNVAAINSHRQLGITQSNVSDSMGKLSSGFRINRAADDAAGLGIANTLRANVRALGQSYRNAEQANSLLQIAEGSVAGIQKMLERMKELATQAGSDTVDAAGRSRVQAEFTALREEITRTVETTKFQGSRLLDGSYGRTTAASVTSSTLTAAAGTPSVSVQNSTAAGTYTLTVQSGTTAGVVRLSHTANGITRSQDVDFTNSVETLNFSEFGIRVQKAGGDITAGTTWNNTNIVVGVTTATNGGQFMVGSSGEYAGQDLMTLGAINVAVGTADTATALGGLPSVSSVEIGGLSLATAAGAQRALSHIDRSISWVSQTLGDLGAFQNRIENAMSNLKTSIQNVSAAESVIRDLDMAEEMTKFSKNQILAQAGTAMLAQANQSSQAILQLLRG